MRSVKNVALVLSESVLDGYTFELEISFSARNELHGNSSHP
jgi:hypothetical protein